MDLDYEDLDEEDLAELDRLLPFSKTPLCNSPSSSSLIPIQAGAIRRATPLPRRVFGRRRQLNVRLEDADWTLVHALLKRYDCTVTVLIEDLLREWHRSICPAKETKPTTKAEQSR